MRGQLANFFKFGRDHIPKKKIPKILTWLDFHGNIYFKFYFWLIRNVAAFESRTKFIFQPVVTRQKTAQQTCPFKQPFSVRKGVYLGVKTCDIFSLFC